MGIKFVWLFQPDTVLLCSGSSLLACSLPYAILLEGVMAAQLTTAEVFYRLLSALSLYALPWLVDMTWSELVALVRHPLIRANR